MNQLGGTIKIGEVINDKIDRTQLAKFLQSKAGTSKLNFGLVVTISQKNSGHAAQRRN